MSFFLLFIQNLDDFRVCVLVISENVMVLEVFQSSGIDAFILDEFIEHFDENGIIGPEHHPKVDVSIHFVDENGVSWGIAVEQGYCLNQITLPLVITKFQAGQ